MKARSRSLVVALLLLFAACRSDKRTPIVVYLPHGRDLLDLVEKTYKAKHPEADIRRSQA